MEAEIWEKANLYVLDKFKAQFLKLLCRYQKVISSSKTDLGRCKTNKHCLHLKDDQSVFQWQFPLKPEHQHFIEQSLQE